MKYIKRAMAIFITLYIFSAALFSQTAEKAAEHAQRKIPTIWDFLVNPRFITKFIVMLLLGLAVFVLLKTKKMKKLIKVILLLLATFLFGFLGNISSYFIMHPSPMCATTKSMLYGFRIPLVITVGVIFLLTLIGPRLYCGWVCPVGAVQELVAMLADKLGLKRKKFSFTLAQTVRLLLFLVFIFFSTTAVIHGVFQGETYAISLYDYINPFHGMEIGTNENLLAYLIHYVPFLLTIILAFKYYRPFCHFVCPAGLFTHWLEQIALFRITYKKNSCNNCNICVDNTPCPAIPEIIKEAALRPDCYACNNCIEECSEGSFEIGIKRTVKIES